MNILCPICKTTLTLSSDKKTYKCSNNHSFDIAKSGYLNLLVSKTNSGDNKEMVNARSLFLEKGYYKPLAEKINQLANSFSLSNKEIVDAGCGTGYYSNFLKTTNNRIYGFDISKYAIDKAKKTYKNNDYFVSSTSALPIPDNSVDILLTVFAPTFIKEFYRILKSDGIFILVVPSKEHLYELKESLYDNPYLNEEKDFSTLNETFNLIKKENLKYKVKINNQDLHLLLEMTPYFYKTDPTRLNNINITDLNLTLDFTIYIYKK